MLSQDFETFCKNIELDNYSDMEKSVKGITQKLNKHFYGIDNDTQNMYIVGSVGRQTAAKNTSDLDIIFDMPKEVYSRINDNDGNKQSQLLQEVKKVLQEKYPNTDIRGDGQVVVISFSRYTIELVPGFKNNDDSFCYPDTNNGGSWKITNPLPEIMVCKKLKNDTNNNYTNVCHMLRAWKNENGFKFKGLLIDTLVDNFFANHVDFKRCGYDSYFDLVLSLFEFLKNQDSNQNFWHALGSNQKIYNDDNGTFVKKALRVYEELKEINKDSDNVNDVLNNIFGNEFPKNLKIVKNQVYIEEYEDTEEFIYNKYPVDISHNLSLDCTVTQNGFRPASLREMIKNHIFLKKDNKLEFYINNSKKLNEIGIDKILWKVKNEGPIAKQKNMIRGQIVETNSYSHKERTDFSGNHYVEAYAIKNGVCIAKGRIEVPIKID